MSAGVARWDGEEPAELFPIDAWRVLHADQESKNGYTFPVWNPHVRLDYVFTPAEFGSRFTACEVRREPEKVLTASDHFPLLVEIST